MSQDAIESNGGGYEAAPPVTVGAPSMARPYEEADGPRADAKPRVARAAVLGVSIALAAALGSVVGALAGAALMRPDEPLVPTMTAGAKPALSQANTDLAALKSSVEASAKALKAQIAQLTERLDRVEKAADPAKLARLSDAVERLDKKSASADVTGSIAVKEQQRPPLVTGWVLRDIFDGRAVIESRDGLYEVGPGSNIPGLGRIETIKRQDGRWVVVTPRGLIVSSR